MNINSQSQSVPRQLGIVTASDGSGGTRYHPVSHPDGETPIVQLILYPGACAGREERRTVLSGGIRDDWTSTNVDVIIVGRGGGSMEDLWAFNEEKVAQRDF